jgi:hypothetical protein
MFPIFLLGFLFCLLTTSKSTLAIDTSESTVRRTSRANMLSASALPLSTCKDDIAKTHCLTSTSTTTTESTSLPLTTITDIVAEPTYCFTPNDGDYVRFAHKDAQAVVYHFCSQNPVLELGSKGVTDYHTDEAGNTVHISAKWADDQTDCAPM